MTLQGLGFVSLSQMRQRPPFYTMLVEKELTQSLFSIWLSPDPEVLEAGELVLGGTNAKRYTGDVMYLDVSSTTYVPACAASEWLSCHCTALRHATEPD